MTFPGIKGAQEREDIIAYLKAVSENKAPAAGQQGNGMRAHGTKLNLRSEDIQAIQGMAQSVLDRLFSLYGMTREIVKRLRPEVIDTLGLRDAVEEMIRQYNSSACYVRIRVSGSRRLLRSTWRPCDIDVPDYPGSAVECGKTCSSFALFL
jgi:hypothetical protein